ncbi:GntR family transcriptional regulator [Clostridiaceae bacterium 35-E11]
MQKIEKAISYKEKVYKELKSAIIAQKIKPGELLNERKLAEELGISRTPVREALQMLVNDGWVIVEPWKGAYVNPITEKALTEVFQVRLALETLAIELIVDKITEEELEALSDVLLKQEKLREDYQADAFIKVDREFHMIIAQITDNKLLIDMLNNLSDTIRRIGVQAVKDVNRYMETLDEHTYILNALKERSKEKAINAMKEHILLTNDNISKRFQESQMQEEA